MLNGKYFDKVAYAARNNNLNAGFVYNIAKNLSDLNSEKVVVNDYIPYLVSHKDRDITSVGKYYNWGLMQVPGILFLNLPIDFSAKNVIELLQPVMNIEAGCKIIRYLKKDSTLENTLYKYVTCDIENLGYESMDSNVSDLIKRLAT